LYVLLFAAAPITANLLAIQKEDKILAHFTIDIFSMFVLRPR